MIDVRFETKELTRWLSAVEKKQIPFATSVALNRTAVTARNIAQRVMRRVFDRPTPFVIRGLKAKMSTKGSASKGIKRDLTASVGYRLWPGKSLQDGRAMIQPHVTGGKRGSKRVETLLRNRGIIEQDEFLTPSKYAKRDSFGNINRGTVQKMLSDLGAQFDSAQNTNMKKKASFFVGTFGKQQQKMIVRRGQGGRLIPFMIVIKEPHYKAVFDLDKIVQHTVRKHYSKNFKTAFAQAMRTAR